MGKGKGSPEYWVARVKPGRIMFEIDGVPWNLAQQALTLAAAKLPLDTVFAKWNFDRASYREGVDIAVPRNLLFSFLPKAVPTPVPRPELCTSIGNIEFPHYMKEDPDISIIDEALSEDNVRGRKNMGPRVEPRAVPSSSKAA